METVLDQHLMIGYSSTETAGGMIVADEHVLRPPVVDYQLARRSELGYFNTDKPHPRGSWLSSRSRFMAGYYKRPELTGRDVRRRRLLQNRRHHGRGRARTTWCTSTGATMSSSSRRASSSPSRGSRRSTPPARWSGRSTSTAAASGRFCWRWSCPRTPHPTRCARSPSRWSRSRAITSSTLRDPARLPARERAVQPGQRPSVGHRKVPAAQAEGRYGPALESSTPRWPTSRSASCVRCAPAAADQPVLATVVRAVQATLGCIGSATSTRKPIRRPRWRFAVRADAFRGCSRISSGRGAGRRDGGPDRRPAGGGQIHRATIVTRTCAHADLCHRVHGADSVEVHADDLTLDKFLARRPAHGTASLPRPSGEVRTVLLTGATGYPRPLRGLEWLERLADSGGTLICLARGADAVTARAASKPRCSVDARLLAALPGAGRCVISRCWTATSVSPSSDLDA